MKLKKRYVASIGVAVVAAAAAITPMVASNAAVACVAGWSAGQIYVGGNSASQNGHNYSAKWWTQGESPATHSGQWDVWADKGTCGGTTPPPTTAPTTRPPTTAPTTRPPTTPPTTAPTTRPPTTPPTTAPTTAPPSSGVNLDNPAKKDVAMQIVSAAENSSLDWRAQFSYIEDIGDGRGYTAGIIGFCSGTGDMLELVEAYTKTKPDNVLAKYLPALRKVNNTDSHSGLDPNFTKDWKTAAADSVFKAAQESERDRVYFNPSVAQGKADGVRALGQFAYYDASVVHGYEGMESVRSRALKKAKPPSQGGNETTWLNAFLDERVVEMKKEEAHSDVSRIETAQRVFLRNGNFDLNTPLAFAVYGEQFRIN
jgi:hypothetical protein